MCVCVQALHVAHPPLLQPSRASSGGGDDAGGVTGGGGGGAGCTL